MTKQEEGWEKGFDKEFPRFENRAFTEDTATALKSFINTLLERVIDDIGIVCKCNSCRSIEIAIKQSLKDKYGIK